MTPVNILIVDDKEENIVALEALLKRSDIKLISTTSPNEALKIAWEHPIAIALVDVQMPEMDGFELVEMLKSNPRTRDIMVIFVTAISKESKYAVKGLGTGAVDYLFKPLDPYITSAKVDSFVQLARSRQELKVKNDELQNYAVVVKNSADIICAINASTYRIESINPAVERVLGYKPNEVLDKSIIDLAAGNDKGKFKAKLDEIVTDPLSSQTFECRFETFSKRNTWVECRMAHRSNTIFLNISDISPQKSFQDQLIKSKEAAEYGKKVKENFLANMSHELRTPINGIIGITGLLRKTPMDDQQNSMLNLLEVSSQSLLGVINDVLDLSKIESGKFSIIRAPHNIRKVVQAVFDLMKFKADERNVELLLELDENLPDYINVDSLRLNQILMNLLSNAIKFTERGYVKLKVKVLHKHREQVKLKFSVEDSGIGIAADRLALIFESFEQAEDDTSVKYGGTGLGLTIVKKLVELKGGELTVSSQIGKGSIFSATNWFAVASEPVNNTQVVIPKKLNPFPQLNVLVAEDNLVNQFMLSKILKDWDVNVDVVDNGRKVIERLKDNNYDLILMDTHMPEMNGYQTAKAIRLDFEEPKRSIPILSLSAATFDYEQQQAISSGMNDVLPKPFQAHELHLKMSKMLDVAEAE
ncbi:response regulator [Mucilaginibacter sp.]